MERRFIITQIYVWASYTLESVLGRSSRPPLWQECLKSVFRCHVGHPPLALLHISPNRRGSIRRAPPWQHGSQLTKCCLDGMRLLLSAVEPFAQILLSIDEFFVLQQFSRERLLGGHNCANCRQFLSERTPQSAGRKYLMVKCRRRQKVRDGCTYRRSVCGGGMECHVPPCAPRDPDFY